MIIFARTRPPLNVEGKPVKYNLKFKSDYDNRMCVVEEYVCHNPDCSFLHLKILEADENCRPIKGGRKVEFSVDFNTWEPKDLEGMSRWELETIDSFFEYLDEEKKLGLLNSCKIIKGQEIPPKDLLSAEDVQKGVQVTCFAAGEEKFIKFQFEGQQYQLFDTYCSKPDCDCKNVILSAFHGGTEELPSEEQIYLDARLYFNKKIEILDISPACGINEQKAKKLITELIKSDKKLMSKFKERYKEAKKLGADSLKAAGINPKKSPKPSSTQKPKSIQKVGRNSPCPCGSGKKYKKCCGR